LFSADVAVEALLRTDKSPYILVILEANKSIAFSRFPAILLKGTASKGVPKLIQNTVKLC